MKIVIAIAGMIGITLIAGSNAMMALGLGLIGLAGYLVVTGLTERLDRIDQGLRDLQHATEAHRLTRELARSSEHTLESAHRGDASSGSV